MSMGNLLGVGGVPAPVMAVKDTAPMGVRHLTVVPENFRRDGDDDAEAESDPEPRVPRHR